jgi:hypothetical protein
MNLLAAEILTATGRVDLNKDVLTGIRRSLEAKTQDDPDFWSVVGEPELLMYEALAGSNLRRKLARILEKYDDIHNRVREAWRWKSVYDQALFILPKYRGRVEEAKEREAVDQLLDRLKTYAGLGG